MIQHIHSMSRVTTENTHLFENLKLPMQAFVKVGLMLQIVTMSFMLFCLLSILIFGIGHVVKWEISSFLVCSCVVLSQ